MGNHAVQRTAARLSRKRVNNMMLSQAALLALVVGRGQYTVEATLPDRRGVVSLFAADYPTVLRRAERIGQRFPSAHVRIFSPEGALMDETED